MSEVLLAATLTMALTTPMSANAAAFEETYVGEERTESKVYGGMIAPKTTVATNNKEAYNETNTEATTADSGRIYYLKNSHGDIIGQMDEQGNLLASFTYNAFGELVSAVTFQPEQKEAANRFLYAGEQYDETSGLYYLRARHYDVSAGRFTQEDTYLGDGRNLYAYVHSNPLKYVDPTGHVAETCKEDDGTFLDDHQEDALIGAGGGTSSKGFSSTGYTPQLGERTITNYIKNNATPEVSLTTNSTSFNNANGRTGGEFKRIGAGTHAGISPHVHQPIRNVAPTGIYGGVGTKTSNGGVTAPTAKDAKQLYDHLNNGKY